MLDVNNQQGPRMDFKPQLVDFQDCLDGLGLLIRQAQRVGIDVPAKAQMLEQWLEWVTDPRDGKPLPHSQRPHGFTSGVCPVCSRKTVDHRHTLSDTLIDGLLRLYHAGRGPERISELLSGRSTLDNFQKLRYWDLVAQTKGPDGKRSNGYWETTDLGDRFCRGEVQLPLRLWTYQGEFVEFDANAKLVGIQELQPNYREAHRFQDVPEHQKPPGH